MGWLQRSRWTAYLARHLIGQARLPFRPIEEIRAMGDRRARAMVRYAYARVPFYRESMQRLGLSPSDFQGVDDLTRLPLVESAEVGRDPDRFVAQGISASEMLTVRSAGSSGMQRAIRWDTAGLFQNAAHGERDRGLITTVLGRSFGYRELVVGPFDGALQSVQDLMAARRLFSNRIRAERRYGSIFEPPRVIAALLDEFRPDVLDAYGSYLDLLFPYLQSIGRPSFLPQVVIYNSDGIRPSVRRLIAEEFGIPLFSTYQASEAFKMAFECEAHDGQHVNADVYPLRIVDADGLDVAPGASGDVVVSNLVNRATVLLNYRLGDTAHFLSEPCPCGRTLPRLSFVEGRRDDTLRRGNGEVLHPALVRSACSQPDVWQFQAVQDESGTLRVSLVAASHADRRELVSRVEAILRSELGEDGVLSVACVETIERTRGGKVRTIIAHPPRT